MTFSGSLIRMETPGENTTGPLLFVKRMGLRTCMDFCFHRVNVLQSLVHGCVGVEFCKGGRQSGLVSVWQHTLVGQ